MAEFNPSTGASATQVPDMTGASRGSIPDRSFEILFSGLGDAIEAGVQTTDNYIQSSIEDNARDSFERLNEEFNLTSDQVPSDLTQSAEGLQRIAMAHQQGKVTQEYYYQRLASTAKGLRAKYPGYEKEVDDIIQKVTGTRPANAFRDAMFANIEATNRALASSKDSFQKWVLQDGNIGYVQMAFPDFFENPGKYSPEEIHAGVAKIKGQEQTWQSQKLQLEGNKEYADQALNERLNQFTGSLLEGQSRALGMSSQDFMQKLHQFSTKGGMQPEEKAEFGNQFEQFISAARTALIKETSDPAFQKLFSSTELRDKREAALQPLLEIRELIASDQYDGAAVLLARLNNMQNQARQALYKQDPRLLAVDTFAKVSPEAGQWLLNDIMSVQGGPTSYFEKVAITDIMAGIIGGDDTINEAMTRVMENKASTAGDKNAQAGAVVQKFTGALKSGTLTPEELSKVVTQNYTTTEKDVFSMVDSSLDKNGNSQYLRLYNEMFNPEITASIVKSGDANALRAYTEAAVDKFQAIPEFRKAAADLGENIDYGKFLRARYDEGTNRLILEADQGAISNMGFFSKSDNRGFVNRAVKAKDALNQALSIVAPIIEANGGDETEGIQTLIKNMAIDLEPQDRGGFFNWINTQLDDLLDGPNPEDQTKSGGGIVSDDSPMGRALKERQKEREGAKAQEGNWTVVGEDVGGQGATPLAEQGDLIQGVLDAQEGSVQQTNYAPEDSGQSAALQAISDQTSYKEIGMTETASLPQGDISWLVPEDTKNLGEAASGPYTGKVESFAGLTNPVEIAGKFKGLNEREHKNVIANFIKKASGININPATTAWCAAFVNGVLGASGGKGTGKLNARSFLSWGQPVDDPQEGDVVVFSRGNSSWQGHVGFYMGTEVRNGETYIKVLGGNQSNKVKESYYPASRLLGYRRAA
jgi:uncharacterized protein (TIGR02594 family)